MSGAHVRFDAFIGNILREWLRAISHLGRARKKVRRHHAWRKKTVPPDSFVEEVFYPFRRGKQRRSSGELDDVPTQPSDLHAVRGVERQVPDQDFPGIGGIVAVLAILELIPQARAANQALRQVAREP